MNKPKCDIPGCGRNALKTSIFCGPHERAGKDNEMTKDNTGDLSAEEIAQWVLNNRYSKGEWQTVPSAEIYHFIVDGINKLCADKDRQLAELKVESDVFQKGFDGCKEIISAQSSEIERLKAERRWIDYKDVPKPNRLVLVRVGVCLDAYVAFYQNNKGYQVWGLGRKEPVTDMDVKLWQDIPHMPMCECGKYEISMLTKDNKLVCGPCHELSELPEPPKQ